MESTCHSQGRGFNFWSRKIPRAVRKQACVLQLLRLCSRARVLQLLKSAHLRAHTPQQEKPPQREAQAPQLEKAHVQQRRPSTAETELIN